MNPFAAPDTIYISRRPQDMRAGIQTLAAKVATDFGDNPQSGALYCFVSRDCTRAKLLRFDVNGWCMYYCMLSEDTFKWTHRPDLADPTLQIGRRELLWLLDGIDIGSVHAAPPVTANTIL